MDVPKHHCPGCGDEQPYSARYPWHFCRSCVKSATDRQGRALVFFNVSMSGGLTWRYADDDASGEKDCIAVGCVIKGRPVLVTEARFGGVVAQPASREMLRDALKKRTNLS